MFHEVPSRGGSRLADGRITQYIGLTCSFRKESVTCIGSMLAALRAGIAAATRAANPKSTVAPVNNNGFHGLTPKSWLAMRYPAAIAAGIPIPNGDALTLA